MKLDWRRNILFITLLGLEGCWLYALVALLNVKVANSSLSIFWLLLLYPIAFGFNRLLRQLKWPTFSFHTISWLAWIVSILLLVKFQLFSNVAWADATWLLAVPRAIGSVLFAFRPELVIFISTSIFWWLGSRLAYLKADFAALVGRFQFGLVILVLIFIISSLVKTELSGSLTVTLMFFLFALAGISISHALEGKSWLSGLYQGHWAGLLLVSIFVILLLGLVIGSLITPDLLQIIVSGLKWLWVQAVKLIAYLISLLPKPESGQSPISVPPPPGATPPPHEIGWHMPEFLRRTFVGGWGVLWIGLILLALWRVSATIFGWLRRRLSGSAGAQYESMSGAFRADFFGWLKRILYRLLGLRLPFQKGRKTVTGSPEAASVRELYRRFLQWAAAGGYPRYKYQTPHEYLGTLLNLLPDSRQELAFITEQYVSARYGTLPQTVGELNRLKESWQKVRQNNLRKINGEQSRKQEAGINGQSN